MPARNLTYRPTAVCSLFTDHSSLAEKYTFASKERDEESGLSYFGSRYYSSDLSIWLAVDPMSDKYPALSPYVYCANNPVKLVDPNGEDWFENELTGDIYYSRDYRKGDEKELSGEGWKWLGENNMFGKSADNVIAANINKADVYTEDNSYSRVGFSGANAKEFMSKMGYKNVPTQVIEYEKSNMQRTWTPAGTLSVDIGGSFQIIEKVGYVNKDFNEVSRKQVGSSVHSIKNECIESVSRQRIEYGKSYSKIGDFLNTVFGGNVNMRKTGPCNPNWRLINEFKKTN